MLLGNIAALGHLELTLGDLERAAGYLRDLPDRLVQRGHLSPVNGPWADTIETLIGLGELNRARGLLNTYRDLARRANGLAQIGAERCAGLLADADGDTSTATDVLQRAVARPEIPMYPFERARTLLALGGAQRHGRQSRAARETLEHALAIFRELDAPLWSAKTRDELGRVSGRRPAGETLTDAERRVAQLAAGGLRNKEIATALFLSVGTVEAHLSRVYRKLGVRSRTELAQRFPEGPPMNL